jgi:hypothetical protein
MKFNQICDKPSIGSKVILKGPSVHTLSNHPSPPYTHTDGYENKKESSLKQSGNETLNSSCVVCKKKSSSEIQDGRKVS